jgi:hypothetical protein
MIIPAILTLGTLGAMYYTRGTVSELAQGKNYRLGLNFNAPLFQKAATDQGQQADLTKIPFVISTALSQIGFTNVKPVSGPTAGADGLETYVYDGTWSKPDKYISGMFPPYLSAPAVYAKLPLL